MKRVIYSPILKSKRGEAKSLQHLAAPVKARIIPFFDILELREQDELAAVLRREEHADGRGEQHEQR